MSAENNLKLIMVCFAAIVHVQSLDIQNCDYFDTVDLTGSNRYSNGSYLFDGVLIPAELTGEYTYDIIYGGKHIQAAKHIRGCACQLMSCIRFCCPPNKQLVKYSSECSDTLSEIHSIDSYFNITLEGKKLDKYVVQRGFPLPCAAHYPLSPEDDWKLFKNGTFLRMHDNTFLSKSDYCFQPEKVADTNYTLQVYNCASNEMLLSTLLRTCVMVISVVCLLLTISVYKSLPTLDTLHGHCYVNYLICLTIGYTILIMDFLKLSEDFCRTAGYIGYFAIMAAFLWLTIVNLALWTTFLKKNYYQIRHDQKKRIFHYNLCVWSISAILLIIVLAADIISDDNTPLVWVPGIGYYSCWIKTQDWSALAYFYGPMLILILFNVILFVLTASRIYELKQQVKSNLAYANSQLRLQSDEQTYSTFLRLFFIMGVTWMFEIFSYFSQTEKTLRNVFRVADYLNSAQGIIIFVLFVLKRSTLRPLLHRISQRYSRS